MAKKKSKKTIKDQLLTPVSFKRAVTFFILFALLSGINMYAFLFFPDKRHKQDVMSQSDLMNVLGQTVTLGQTSKEEYAPFYNKPEVSYWYEILRQKPDFRDAHLMLATLAYNDHNCQLSQSHYSSAYTIDPTDPKIAQLKSTIEDCNK